jgi:hypothetical protein
MSFLNRIARDPNIVGEQLDQIKVMQRQIAYDVLQKKTPMTPAMEQSIVASMRDLTLDEQYRLVEQLYIKSQLVDNDPGSFWPKVNALGLDPRKVMNMLNSLRLEISLLQISKAMIKDPAERQSIDLRIAQLKERRALERLQGVRPEARYPREMRPPGGFIPPTPGEDILNPMVEP